MRRISLSRPWICRSYAQRSRTSFPTLTSRQLRRNNSGGHNPADQESPASAIQAHYKRRNQTILNYSLSLLIGTVALSYASVPLYKTICQQMGWGGQPIKSKSHFGSGSDSEDPSARLKPVTTTPRIRITFSGSVSSILPWKFVPQQREVRVLPGETALAFYTATNTSDEDIIGVATYSVVPDKVAPYFSKIQCFCFEEQRLNAGETVDMPVFFYIDPDFVNDPSMKNVLTVTLHYTFFKAKYDRQGHLFPVPMTP